MTSVNKPADYMHVYVTPAEFADIYEARKVIDMRGSVAAQERLQGLLYDCALKNGGLYDPSKHRKGDAVELIVIV